MDDILLPVHLRFDWFKTCCLQVFSQEKGIQTAVEEAFSSLYIQKSPAETATNLIDLTLDANLGDLASIEALVSKFMGRGDIAESTVLLL